MVSSSFFLVFLSICFIAGISIRVLTVDVSSVVGAPWRCGVLTILGGIAGVGWDHVPGREHGSTLQSGVGGSSPVKTEPPQIVLLFIVVVAS